MSVQVEETKLADDDEARTFLTLLDAYARDPMGGSRALPEAVRERLVPDMRERIARGVALVLIARRGSQALGVAVCFAGYSTFAARPLWNLHDLAVLPEARGSGVGQALLGALETRARAQGACKLTLEVQEDNARARRLYEHVGFVDYSPSSERRRTLFLEKKL